MNNDSSLSHHRSGLDPKIIILIIILVIGGGFYYFKNKLPFSFSKPSGSIYLSLVPMPATENPIAVYRLDITTKTLSQFMPPNETLQEEYFTSKLSPDGKKIAFASMPYARGNTTLHVQNVDGSEKLIIKDPDNVVIRRSPTWSSDGQKVAYTGKKRGTELDILDTESFGVYVYDFGQKKESFITNGVNPLFIPNGNILVLKNDGLYVFGSTEQNASGEKIWDVEGDLAYANMKLDVSSDGKKIAWSAPGRKSIYIISVDSWEPFSGFMDKVLPYGAYWPVFSPDGKYLAFEEADIEGLEVKNPRLSIYNLRSDKKETLLDLDKYYQLSMFITDWR